MAIDEAIDPVRARLGAFKWVPPKNWHVTLKYYGHLPPERIGPLEQALHRATSAPIPCAIRGMGGFPHLRDPKVLWVGLKNTDGKLVQLHRKVQDVSATLGFEPDGRKFQPHITVARIRPDHGHPVARELTPLMDTPISDTTFDELVLYRSDLSPTGAVYTPLSRFRLE